MSLSVFLLLCLVISVWGFRKIAWHTRQLPFYAFGSLSVVLVCASLGLDRASGQLATAEEKGLPPNSVFHLGDIDAVNLENGNLHLSIPIMSSKQRGGTTLSWNLVYDTPLWIKKWVPDYCPQTAPQNIIVFQDPAKNPLRQLPCPPSGAFAVSSTGSATTGWRFVSPESWGLGGTLQTANCPIGVNLGHDEGAYTEYFLYTFTTNWQLFDFEGTAHPISLRTENYNADGNAATNTPCEGSNLQGPALDGSGVSVELAPGFGVTSSAATAYMKDGTQMIGPSGQIQDSNGNMITATGDTLNRNDVVVTYDPHYPIPTSGGQPTHQIYTVQDSNGNSQNYLVDFEPITFLSSACAQSGLDGAPTGTLSQVYTCTEGGGTRLFLSQLTLPDNKAYVFTYNPNSAGELARIDLPSGASISYTYMDYYQISYSSVKGQPNNVVGGRAVASRTVTFDGRSYPWTYLPTLLSNTVTDPDRNIQVHNFDTLSAGAGSNLATSTSRYEMSVSYSDSQGRVLRTVQTDYAADYGPLDSTVVNVRPIRTTTTLDNGLVSKKETDYETFPYACNLCVGGGGVATRLNPTEVRDYDYASGSPGSLLRKIDYTYLHMNNPAYVPLNIVNKPATITTYDGVGNQLAQTIYEYDNYSRTAQAMQVSGAGQHNPSFGTSYQPRGNVTAVSRWLNTTGSLLTTTSQYDDAGNVLSTSDSLGNVTRYSFADAWSNASCVKSGIQTQTYPTTITNALGYTVTNQFNSCTGRIASSTDSNGNTTTVTYDLLNRPLGIGFPDGGAKSFCYSDDPNGNCSSSVLSLTTTTLLNSGTKMVSTVLYDGLGNPKENQANSDPSGVDYADTLTNDRGQVLVASNPYRTSSDATYGTSSYSYDALGRKLLQTNPDGNTVQMSYSGNVTTTMDESGSNWQRTEDSLGRLIKVMEPDPVTRVANRGTIYSYDPLGNLTNVTQQGGTGDTVRTRSFSYDSLSRLTSSTNPETGTIGYTYDANSNLTTKTDARGIVTTYSYDALNRLTFKRYSNGTFNAAFGYDGKDEDGNILGEPSANSIGRLSHISNQVNAASSFSYDAMGRLVLQKQCMPSDCSYAVTTAAAYDLAGNMTDLTYPDGHHIQQTFDAAGRLSGANLVDINGISTPASYLQSISYLPDGSPGLTTLGNGVQQSVAKNNRLQVQNMAVSSPLPPFENQNFLSHTYCYVNCTTGGAANNGNIWGITDTLNGTRTQGFTYDALNRISSFSLGGAVNQQFQIDSFGNMSPVVGGNGVSTFDPATNRINNLSCATTVTPFDAAGNQLCSTDQYGAISQYSYDAESRISQIATLNSASPFVSYVYGADGERARKTNADGTFTEYVDFGGQPIAERDQSGAWTDYVYAGGQKIARIPGTDTRFHLTGTDPVSDRSLWVAGLVPVPPNIVIQAKDILSYRIYSHNASAGINLAFTDGSNADWYLNGLNHAPVQDGAWTNVSYSLDGPMVGKLLNQFQAGDFYGPPGEFDVLIADIAITHADGTVTALPVNGIAGYWGYQSNMSAVFASETVAAAADTSRAAGHNTYFSVADHLGTAQMEFAAGGWPVYQGQFAPYGQELQANGSLLPTDATDGSANHYKFTGKERDTESGLDYFGARYYASNMGRWMSPDWSAKIEPVPYSKLDDPQSLNLYSYVRNNPLSRVDVDGHVDWGIQRAWNWLQGKGFKTDAQIQGLSVAQTAHSNLNSLAWMAAPGGTSGHQVFKPGSNKCNEYVGDTLDQSGHQAPMVPDGKGGMRLATAHELADPNVHISGLSDTKPLSQAAVGDVIAQAHGDTEGHTGIIVAPGLTSSANANQGGVVTENDWGFRNPNAPINNGERDSSNSPAPVVRTPTDHPQ